MSPAGNLKEEVERYVKRVTEFHESCRDSEAATKASLVMPLFKILGYDETDPRECQPEYKADFGKVRGKQPVDWAFSVNNSLAFLVEAKAVGKKIDRYDEQLGDYFGKERGATKLGILTTGVQWRFFTDLVAENAMDSEPFLQWDVLKDPIPFDLLAILQRAEFKPELIKAFAKGKLRQSVLVAELTRLLEPSDEFVKLAIQNKETLFEDRNLTAAVIKEWKPILAGAIQEWVQQQKLTAALGRAIDTQDEDHRLRSKRDTPPPATKEQAERDILRQKFWTTLLERAKTKTELHAGVSPNDGGWVATGAGTSGLGYSYVITKHASNVQLYIDRGKDSEEETRAMFDRLMANQQEIERIFGEPLSWEPLEGKRGKRIAKYFELGGYRDDQAKWPQIQDAMIGAMVRLESALKPFIAELKTGA